MWKKLSNTILFTLFAFFGLIILLLFSPLILISTFINKIESKTLEEEYRQYLLEIDGHKLFCYNNRKHTKEFIEKQIMPILPKDVKLIFLDGRFPVSEYPHQFTSMLLYNIRNQVGFPYLLRIQEGNVLEKSINNELYNSLNQGHDTKPLYDAINNFYQ